MSTLFLDDDLLREFEAQLRRIGAPLADNLAPGLTDEAIDGVLAPLGIDLPEEARRWWRWHNGALDFDRPGVHSLLGSRPMYSLHAAAELWGEVGELLLEAWEWPANHAVLTQVGGDRPWLFLFCGAGRETPVPIYAQDDVEPPEQHMASIGELVASWTSMLANDDAQIRPDGTWEVAEQPWPYVL